MNLHLTKKIIPCLFILNLGFSNVLFTDITLQSGINFTGSSEGVCLFDYNNDGWDDIFFTTRGGSRLYLYKNEGGMTFTDVTLNSNLGIVIEGRTPVSGDYDNDGDLDLFIGNANGHSLLFQNDGSGQFQDVTSISGISVSNQVRGCSWVDYDRDGFLDLYVGLLHISNKMYRNNGDGTFVDLAQTIGVEGPSTAGVIMGLGFIDYDRDGDQDLFITQDNNLGNILYKNEGEFFIDVSDYTNVDLNVMGMGVAFGDINRDGNFDFYTTNLYENSLLLNSQTNIFSDISEQSGTEDIPGSMGWGTFFFDANNDGWVDIYNNNETGFGGIPNSLFINDKDSTFTMMGEESGVVLHNNGYGSAFSDLDHDGDLDMVLVGHPSSVGSVNLLRNDSGAQNWVNLRLTQSEQNIFAIGATIELHHSGLKQMNYVAAGNSYCSQNTFDVHFGLGQETIIDSVIVFWPDGISESFSGLVFNEINYLNRGAGIAILNNTSEPFLPEKIRLNDPYPNPFNNNTTLEIQVAKDTKSKLHIYDLKGQEVATFNVQLQKSIMNHYKINFSDLPSGIYFVNIQSSEFSVMRKITLLK